MFERLGQMRVPAGLTNFTCPSAISLVIYFLGIPVAASFASPRPPILTLRAHKIAQFLCILNPLESALIQVFILKSLNSFRMNTYEKTRGRGCPRRGPIFAVQVEATCLC